MHPDLLHTFSQVKTSRQVCFFFVFPDSTTPPKFTELQYLYCSWHVQIPNTRPSWFLPLCSAPGPCFPAMVPKHCRAGNPGGLSWSSLEWGRRVRAGGSQPWEEGHENFSDGWDHQLTSSCFLSLTDAEPEVSEKAQALMAQETTTASNSSRNHWFDFWKTFMVCTGSYYLNNKNPIWNPSYSHSY